MIYNPMQNAQPRKLKSTTVLVMSNTFVLQDKLVGQGT